MKKAFFELEDWEIDYVKKNIKSTLFNKSLFFKDPLTINNVNKTKNIEVLGVFIYSYVTKEILDKLPKLKMIATMSTGYDHIDVEECKRRNIKVCNVPTYGENTVAEHAFALILALSRKIPESIERTKKRNFDWNGLRGFDLKGKTIGIVGTGNIGRHIARMANGFEMNILAYDVKQNPDLAQYNAKYVDLNTLLKTADIVSLHLPLIKPTEHIINKNNIKLMKQGAVLINTSRGGLIETEALAKALKDKKIFAGLDVLEEENMIKEEKQLLSEEFKKNYDAKIMLENNILLDLENAIITPHNAFNSTEALQRILDTSIQNIKSFEKKTVINCVNN